MGPRRRLRRLLVTGGTGFLGAHITRSPAAERWEVIAPGSRSLDLRHADSVRHVVREWKPHAIVHTAYRKDDRASIVDATRHVARAAAEVGARLVHVSTDALFAGRPEPYTEDDVPDPIHDYGRDKADAEIETFAADGVIVRTSLICGTGGGRLSVHETAVRDAIVGRTSTAFFTDEVRSPVRVDDLAASLIDLASMPGVRGVLHLGGPTPMSRARLAHVIASHHGWEAHRIRTTSLAETGLGRPANVVLDSTWAAQLGLAVRGPGEWRSLR